VETEKQKIRVGLVGCGQIAQSVHLKILSDLPGTRLAAIAEAHDQRREAVLALAPRVPAFSDYHELLALDNVDAVVLALPTGLHAAAAIAAFEAGKHVYLEKPLATNLDDAQAVLAAWRGSSRVGMIGFNYRFNRLHREAKGLLQTGRLGCPVAVRSIFSSVARPLPAWKEKRESGGGVLLDLASHHIDLVRFLFGEPIREVACSLSSREAEDDTATLQLRLADGLLVQSFFSHRAADEDRLELYCERGSIKVDRRHGLVIEVSGGIDRAYRGDQLRHLWRSARNIDYAIEKFRAFGHEPSWRHALEHFAEAVRGEHPASPDLDDGWRSLEVVLAGEESALTGRTVKIAAPI
jgi:predicted dehydrogenase